MAPFSNLDYVMMNRKIICVVALWVSHHFSFAQQVQIGAYFSPYLNLNRGSVGHGAGGEAYWRTTSKLWLGYGFSYLAESDKVRSYGNPVVDGIGYEQSIHAHSLNDKYFLKAESRINPYLGLGLVYAQWQYNNKTVGQYSF